MQEDDHTEKEHEKKRIFRDPGQLTKAEIDEHNVDHTPYRSWCPSCVRGRAIGTPHRKRRDEQVIPVFGFDYLSAKELYQDEDHEIVEGEAKILVALCQDTGCVFSHVIPQKGVDPEKYAVERLARDIQWLGHTRISSNRTMSSRS